MASGVMGPLVPLSLVLSEEHARWCREALRDAARLVGELRPCNTCGQEIAVFHKRSRHLYFTVATGHPHGMDCIELAVQAVNERQKEQQDAIDYLKKTGQLAGQLLGDSEDG
jgi:hypothetical protein